MNSKKSKELRRRLKFNVHAERKGDVITFIAKSGIQAQCAISSKERYAYQQEKRKNV